MTAQHPVTRRLLYAINAACTARGDTDRNRIELIDECTTLDVLCQRDLAAHFETVFNAFKSTHPPVLGPSGEGSGTGNSKPERGLFDDFAKGVVL